MNWIHFHHLIRSYPSNINEYALFRMQRANENFKEEPHVFLRNCIISVIVMCVVVNIDALAQASDIRIKRRQVVFLCWDQNSKLNISGTHSPGDGIPAHEYFVWNLRALYKILVVPLLIWLMSMLPVFGLVSFLVECLIFAQFFNTTFNIGHK